MRKSRIFLLAAITLATVSCGQPKKVKVTPPKPNPEQVAFQKKLERMREQLRKDYEEFIREAYRIQAENSEGN